MKRRPFILLELFIALALLSLSIIPIASYPMKIYKKELATLIEIQLEELADVAFRDLLLDQPKEFYSITLGNYKYIYRPLWETKIKEIEDKDYLKATLRFIPEDPSSPKPQPIQFNYFVAKKGLPFNGKVHETVCPSGEKTS